VSLVGISGTSRLPVANAKAADKLRARTTARAHIAPESQRSPSWDALS
jgi:hypothetical protein